MEYTHRESEMSVKKATNKYNKLMLDVANNEYYKIDITNRVNCYSCKSCGHITKTKDINPGCTPAFFECEKCNELAHSSFFRGISPLQQPTFEWYRPDIKEFLKMRRNPSMIEHILSGGLLVRPIKTKP